MTAIERRRIMTEVEAASSEAGLEAACAIAGVSVPTYHRWAARYAEAGMDGLEDLPRTGRPPSVVLSGEERDYLRRTYLRSNLRTGAGSMTLSARWAAKDEASPLTQTTREAILKPRASKHILPVDVKRCLRASAAEVSRYRDPKAGQNDGIYTPGWLRMAMDGTRRLVPGERQVWDDGSVNVGVVVPWTRGGDKCSERWGVRVARFQLLAAIDCAGDFCAGWAYVMRANDAYNAADVCAAIHRVWRLNGYAPNECVMEGGAWQASRTKDFLAASGVQLISAKGRPNQKLVEGWFNRLWTVLSVALPGGHVGRFRGEMAAENTAWQRCRDGVCDPREHFPMLTDFLTALDTAVTYLNRETVESREYGLWVPAEGYEAQAVKGHALPSGLRRYALPVREIRRMARQGMVRVSAVGPLGWPHPYAFVCNADGWRYDGGEVIVSFDPAEIGAGAVVELARDWQDHKAGTVIDEAAVCVSAAPELARDADGWRFAVLDARDDARAAKRRARARIGQQVAVYDGRGVKARHAEAEGVEQLGFAGAPPVLPSVSRKAETPEPDWAALETEAGIMVV